MIINQLGANWAEERGRRKRLRNCASPPSLPKQLWLGIGVDANLGQYTNALDRAARERAQCSSPCMERSDRSKEPVRPVAGENRRRPTNANPGGTPSG